ncbi:MMPL family transporter, partial [Streptomyces doudnae]
RLDALMPQLVALMPSMIQSMKNQKQMMLNQYQVQKTQQDQTMAQQQDSTAMGEAFDKAQNDDSFYIPPEVLENKDFKRAMNLFFSPDGKSVRFIISHRGDPATPEGIARVDAVHRAAEEALKLTPLE